MSVSIIKPLIGVPACIKEISDNSFHAVGDKYLRAVSEPTGGQFYDIAELRNE